MSKLNTLRQALIDIVGSSNILFDDPSAHDKRLPYLTESRGRRTGQAQAIVFPSNTEAVAQIVNTCQQHKTPMIPQGGNTGRCFGAQTKNTNAVIINLEKMNRILAMDKENMTITVEAGCILQNIQTAASNAERFFPLSLGAQGSCQIGGNLATNAGGINVLRYGNVRDLTLGVEAVLPNGDVLHDLSGLRKNNTGYDLKNLLIGSEGTLGIITAATLKLFPPERRSEHAFIAVNSLEEAIQCLHRTQMHFSGKVSSFELMPSLAMQWLELYSDLKCPIASHHPWYIWYTIADTQDNDSLFDHNVHFLEQLMQENHIIDATVSQNEGMKDLFWRIRETIVAVQKAAGASLKFDIAVPISAIPALIEAGNAAADKICPGIRPYPFGHVGDGNIHYNLTNPIDIDPDEFLADYRHDLKKAIHDIVAQLNGTFSAEHGIGKQKLDEMLVYKDPVALAMMRSIKRSIDPSNLMNPDTVIPF